MPSSCEFAATKEPLQTIVGIKQQRTINTAISAEGLGVFTGQEVGIRLCPAEEGHGIVFQRVDLPHKPRFPARLEYVKGTPRCTMIGHHQEFVQTVEHLLSALKGLEIDNLLIEISGPEVPIFDGSSLPFVEMIENAGICHQSQEKPIYSLNAPIYWTQDDIQLIALPSKEYRVSYTLHYPHSLAIGTQFYSSVVTEEKFKKEIAPCRTFSIYEEIAPMIEKGLVKGSLENAVIFKENKVVNPEGLRFTDEMVRHKVLDLIGDLSLVPFSFVAHIIAIRSGHTSNIAFGKELYNHMKMECN